MPILESRFQIYALLKQAFGSLNRDLPRMMRSLLDIVWEVLSAVYWSDGDITKPALELMTIRQQNRFKNIQWLLNDCKCIQSIILIVQFSWLLLIAVQIMRIVGLPWQRKIIRLRVHFVGCSDFTDN